MKTGIIISGDKVFIRPMKEQDAPFIVEWRNDPEIKKWMFNQEELTIESHLKWFNEKRDQARIDYIICDKKLKQPIGSVNFTKIEKNIAEAGKMIGNKEYWGRGFASEAFLLWLKFGFTNLNFNVIYVQTMKNNITNIKLNEKLGFKLKEQICIVVNNRNYDIIVMEIRKKDLKW